MGGHAEQGEGAERVEPDLEAELTSVVTGQSRPVVEPGDERGERAQVVGVRCRLRVVRSSEPEDEDQLAGGCLRRRTGVGVVSR
ncbi:hypothetical protein GCM10029978_102390 [Actinoallomurus acanthiterrae]